MGNAADEGTFSWGTLVAVLVVLGIIIGVVVKVSGMIATSNKKLTQMDKNLSSATIAHYDNAEVSGLDVQNCIKTVLQEHDIKIYVKTNKGTKTTYSKDSKYSTQNLKPNSPNYIEPTASFYGTVQNDDNESLESITFEQE